MANTLQAYKGNSILTASKGELTLMLYDGAIKFVNKAIIAIEKEDIEQSHINIVKAQNIIDELEITLDSKYKVAENMRKIYQFIKSLLIDANMGKDVEKLEQANYLIREFRDTWKQVIGK